MAMKRTGEACLVHALARLNGHRMMAFCVASVILAWGMVSAAHADVRTITFENPPYALGSIDTQDGWSGGGGASTDPIDPSVHQAVTNATAYGGSQSWFVSNDTSLGNHNGAFGGWPFGPPLAAAAGQPSSGAPSDKFFATFWFKAGSSVADGSNMEVDLGTANGDDRNSFLAITNRADADGGLQLRIQEPVENGLGGCGNWYPYVYMTNLDRTVWHRMDFLAEFIDGDYNDTIEYFLDGATVVNTRTGGTTWFTFESYRNQCGYAYAQTNRIYFRSGRKPSDSGAFADGSAAGIFFDNLTYQTSCGPRYVATTGTDTGDNQCAVALPCLTIQHAIDVACAGDTVNVAAGMYTENVAIGKSLTLIGAGMDSNPAANTIITQATSGPGITITASDVTVSQLRVQDCTIGGASDDGVRITGIVSNILIDHVAATNTAAGVGMENSGLMTNITLQYCHLFNNRNAGMYVYFPTHVDGLTIDHCDIENNAYEGIFLYRESYTDAPTNTNVHITNTTLSNNAPVNADGTDSGEGNITIYGFNGNLEMSNVTVDATGADYGILISGTYDNPPDDGSSHPAAAGTMSLTNVSVTGAPVNAGITLAWYSDISHLTFDNVTSDVNLESGVSDGGRPRAALRMRRLLLLNPTTINLGNTVLAGSRGSGVNHPYDLVASEADIDATHVAFAQSDPFAIEDLVLHRLDDPDLFEGTVDPYGLVTWVPNNVYVTPESGSIQRGIDAVNSGGTVNVAAGTYNESPQVNKALTLQSTGGRDVTFIALQTGPTYLGSLDISGSDVTIDGFTIIGRDGTPSQIAASNIFVDTTGNPLLNKVVIKNNRLQVGLVDPATDNGDDGMGILTTYLDTGVNVNSLTVSNNLIVPLNSEATRVFYINPGVDAFTFQGNHVTGKFDGRAITQAKNGLVEDNDVDGQGLGGSGLGTWGYPDAAVWGHTTFSGNVFSALDTALSIFETNNVVIKCNLISGNATGVGIFDGYGTANFDPTTIDIQQNSILDNSTDGVNNSAATPGAVPAQNNWWGCVGGPGGSCNSVSGGVTVIPFATSVPTCVSCSADADCDDGSACTTDTCDSASRCMHTPISCDDGSACTTDTCDPASGCVHTPISCNDGNVCTDDSCNPASGCVHDNNTASCNTGDTCQAGVCTGRLTVKRARLTLTLWLTLSTGSVAVSGVVDDSDTGGDLKATLVTGGVSVRVKDNSDVFDATFSLTGCHVGRRGVILCKSSDRRTTARFTPLTPRRTPNRYRMSVARKKLSFADTGYKPLTGPATVTLHQSAVTRVGTASTCKLGRLKLTMVCRTP